jgi:hypothetical protein
VETIKAEVWNRWAHIILRKVSFLKWGNFTTFLSKVTDFLGIKCFRLFSDKILRGCTIIFALYFSNSDVPLLTVRWKQLNSEKK